MSLLSQMNIEPTDIIKYAAYLGTLAAAIAIEHLAFRTPRWKRRELARRFIGDTTVLVLFALFLLIDGTADAVTWVAIVGGFAIAAAVKVTAAWYDATRLEKMTGLFNDTPGED